MNHLKHSHFPWSPLYPAPPLLFLGFLIFFTWYISDSDRLYVLLIYFLFVHLLKQNGRATEAGSALCLSVAAPSPAQYIVSYS